MSTLPLRTSAKCRVSVIPHTVQLIHPSPRKRPYSKLVEPRLRGRPRGHLEMLERGQPALANHLRQGAASAVADARILASKLTRVTFLVLLHTEPVVT